MDDECRDWSAIIAGEGAVGCPTPGCTQNNIHPTRVTVNRGGEVTVVDHRGTRVYQGRADGRGVAIMVDFECEDGHGSELKLHFHKGETECEFAPGPRAVGMGGWPPPTIWCD